MTNLMKMMKQAAEMQKNLARAQDLLAGLELEHTAAGGAVRIKITGAGRITAIRLAPEVVTGGDVEMLEDLLLTAVRGAQDLAQETAAREMQKLTAGLNLPPGLGL